ncbi:major royal jelly protein [Sporormia fimetaria CBS 119925]|uniref:Major royal jelly protein n=1 Tax=Sporormia fimetaria CBS 119925 TaxID=1340428 RepID=A0A6A6UZK0_9PLEO|nr:major royal jelly protein [Sporormia fimetaria CBS 119925]
MFAVIFAALVGLSSAQYDFVRDPGVYGPPLETVHAFFNQWPTGIAVSQSGRIFTNFPGGLDPANVYNGSNTVFTAGELTSVDAEEPYPSREINSPPGGAINYTTTPPSGANYPNYLLGVQSVVIDSRDRLWILDTGRVLLPDGSALVPSVYGGPKLIGVDLSTNQIFQTILFPETVAYPDSYLNDVRFDLRNGASTAYITDSSSEGRNGIVIVDLGTGESWRHLNLDRSVRSEPQFLPFVWGQPIYMVPAPGEPITHLSMGSDGIAISADGEHLYYGPIGSRYLYSVPTSLLNDRSLTSELMAQQGVRSHGQKGVSDGFETDSEGRIYMGNMEQNGIVFYDPRNGPVNMFVRDPKISWADTMSVATDGYLYFTDNQLGFGPLTYLGDRRKRPFAVFRVPLPEGATKVGS